MFTKAPEFGVLKYKNGTIYYGYLKGSNPHGLGVERNMNGQVYFGEWNNGLKDGHGVHEFFKSGSKFSGEFVKNERRGYIVAYYKDGSSTAGPYKNGLFFGY